MAQSSPPPRRRARSRMGSVAGAEIGSRRIAPAHHRARLLQFSAVACRPTASRLTIRSLASRVHPRDRARNRSPIVRARLRLGAGEGKRVSATIIPNDEKPAALGYRMPAEWEPHAATWLSWPRREGISFPESYARVLPTLRTMVAALLE